MAEAFDHEEIISTANIEGLRLFAVQKNGSTEEVDDVIDVMSPGGGWVRSNSVGYTLPSHTSQSPPLAVRVLIAIVPNSQCRTSSFHLFSRC